MILLTTPDSQVWVYDGELFDRGAVATEDSTARRLASGDWSGGVPVKFNGHRRYINPNHVCEAWVKP